MSKLVRSADDERIKGVARVELVVRRIEIQFRLRDRGCIWRSGLRLGANVFEQELRLAHFREHRLQELPISLRQPLAEEPRRHADDQSVLIRAFLPRGTKPGSETVWVDAPLRVLQDLVPEV